MRGKLFLPIVMVMLSLVQPAKLSAQDAKQDQTVKRVNYSDPSTWLLGYFNHDSFLLEPHNAWYNSGFDGYTFDDEAFVELSRIPVDNLTITIVLGTWCPDSRRELPRFMKIMESWGFDSENILLIGVDSYKVAPIEGYSDLNIDRVPTFIIYRNKSELGRIIEYPKASLERDMVNILSETEK